MRLGPNKHGVPNVVAEIATDVKHKMVDALIVGAGGETAGDVRSVEAQALGPDASHDIGANFFVPGTAEIGVEIIEQGPKGLDPEIHGLPGAPRNLAVEADGEMR